MSLVGSLEDLGLADILQIVSLSRKSGLLLLRSEAGDGRIVFSDGLVRAAYVKGEPEDLLGLLKASGMADGAVVEEALEAARQSGRPRLEVLSERTGLSRERLDSLCREHVERAVLRIFQWRIGEFSFDVRDAMEERDQELALRTGVNAQFLTMEATRLGDENEAADGDASPPVDEFVLSGEAGGIEGEFAFGGAETAAPPPDVETEAQDPHEVLAIATAAAAEEDEIPRDPFADVSVEDFDADPAGRDPDDTMDLVAPEPTEAPSAEAVAREAAAPAVAVAAAGEPPAAVPTPADEGAPTAVPLVVIDRDLRALEWIKSITKERFARVHILQHVEAGIGRIRHYLMRGDMPTVLVSCAVPADSLSERTNVTELIQRLRAQAPRMPILVMHDGSPPEGGIDAADAVVVRPPSSVLSDRRRRAEVEEGARSLLGALEPWTRRQDAGPPAPSAGPRLERLREISDRMRDPATLGDVLTLVMEFASESFGRVAMFMVRDHEAVGIAQRGLAEAGGPDDEALRALSIPLDEPACFRAVVEGRRPRSGAPTDAGDRRLVSLLGDGEPSRLYVAPIESGGRVAAILYADNLPEDGPLADATALDIVLHEAGLALDRALLERALAEAEG